MITLGLDISLTGTGWSAINTDTGMIATETISTKPGDTLTRIRFILDEIPHTADLACIEQPSYASAGGQAHERAGLWWMVMDKLARAGVPVAVVAPKTLKLFATGAGTATKTQMSDHLRKRLGDRCPDVEDDNQVDACWLAMAAAVRLGVPLVALPGVQLRALDKVSWPDLPSDDEVSDLAGDAA
jgi:crossover junction endodeoxyribonuclease RuvC